MNDDVTIRCPSCRSAAVTCLGTISPASTFAGRVLPTALPGGELYKCASCSLHFRYPRLEKPILDGLYAQGVADIWAHTYRDRTDWRIAKNWITARLHTGNVLD